MHELLSYCGTLVGRTYDHSRWLKENGIITPDPFYYIHNQLRNCLVTLDLYYKHWGKPKQSDIKNRQYQIIQGVTNCVFISAMSAVESSIKVFIKSDSNKEFQKIRDAIISGEEVKFINILGRSKNRKVKIISKKDYQDWNFLRILRNCGVHNNYIPNHTENYNLNGREFNLIKDQMILATDISEHIFFVDNVDRLLFKWIGEYLNYKSTSS